MTPLQKRAAAWRALPLVARRTVISYFTSEAEQSDAWSKDPLMGTAAEHIGEAKAFRAAVQLLRAASKKVK